MLLGCKRIRDKLHGVSEKVKDESAGVGYAVNRGEKIVKKHKYQLL